MGDIRTRPPPLSSKKFGLLLGGRLHAPIRRIPVKGSDGLARLIGARLPTCPCSIVRDPRREPRRCGGRLNVE